MPDAVYAYAFRGYFAAKKLEFMMMPQDVCDFLKIDWLQDF